MKSIIDQLEKNHQAAIKSIGEFRSAGDSISRFLEVIDKYKLTVFDLFAGMTEEQLSLYQTSSCHFAGLLSTMHHAIYDDGSISFPVVNKVPYITFMERDNPFHLREIEKTNDIRIRMNTLMSKVGGKQADIQSTPIFLNSLDEFIDALLMSRRLYTLTTFRLQMLKTLIAPNETFHELHLRFTADPFWDNKWSTVIDALHLVETEEDLIICSAKALKVLPWDELELLLKTNIVPGYTKSLEEKIKNFFTKNC